jgi:hypothetical protein
MTTAAFTILVSLTLAEMSPLPQKPAEAMHIDGRKNPELIPDWTVWESALKIIAGGSKQLPSNVLKYTTSQEEALIMREAEQQPKRYADCKARILALKPDSDKPEALPATIEAIRLEYRWAILRSRDRILAAVSPEVRTELLIFIDHVRSVTTVDILKRDLDFFLQPQ